MDSGSESADCMLVMQVEERVFGQTIESLDAHIERLQALTDKYRYSLLYLLYQEEELTREELERYPGVRNNRLEELVQPLLDTSLVTVVPGPGGRETPETKYRVTTLGRQQIEGDIEQISGTSPDEHGRFWDSDTS